MATGTANQTYNLYKSVIDEVIKNVRDAFMNEGHDEKVIFELKNAWEHRLRESEAVKVSKNDNSLPDTSSTIYPHNTISKTHQSSHIAMSSGSGSLVGNFQSGSDHRVRELEVQSQSMYSMKQHMPLPQHGHHSMHSFHNYKHSPFNPIPMFLSPPMQPMHQPFESSLGSPEDKPSKDQLPGLKFEGKRPQSDASVQIDKVPSAKRSRVGQLDGNGGGQGSGNSGAGASGGADIIEYSTDDDDDGDDLDDDDQSDDSEVGPEVSGGAGSAGKTEGAKGATGGEGHPGRDLEGAEGDEELGSTDDDDSGEDHEDHFETDNMVVCQFKKVTRTRNKWRFHLKDGIMNLNGFDQVFSQATGEADW